MDPVTRLQCGVCSSDREEDNLQAPARALPVRDPEPDACTEPPISCGVWGSDDAESSGHTYRRAEVVSRKGWHGNASDPTDSGRESRGGESRGGLQLDEELCGAVSAGDVHKVEGCLNGGACIEARPRGCTPLQLAVVTDQSHMVQRLLWHNAQVDVRDPATGCTPLFTAAQRGQLDICQALLRAKAQPDAVDRRNCTVADVCDENIWPRLEQMIARAYIMNSASGDRALDAIKKRTTKLPGSRWG